MDLIPLDNGGSEDDPLEIKMSLTAMQLANVQTSEITMQKPVKEVRLNGKVQVDERYVFSQTSHIAGRIEKLMVDYTGEYVKIGQVLAYIYSPNLVTAQEELFQAYKIRESQPELYQAARSKLKNWKLTDTQIENIIRSGSPLENFPILSDNNGVVLIKNVHLGDHIEQGSSLFEVADLTKIWVLFDVYESDMAWVKKGDEVSFTLQSFPGEKFEGKISFIDPVINPATRVAKARIAINNPGLRIKPEMFVTGILKSPLKNQKLSIIIPKTAVMWTGERSVVYVKTSSSPGISFEMREVTLGPSLEDNYLITEGLHEGEEIVTNGTFSVDAAAQLAGKPSMMNPVPQANNPVREGIIDYKINHTIKIESIHLNDDANQSLAELIESYIKIKDALVNDDFNKSVLSGKNLQANLDNIKLSLFEGNSRNIWEKHSSAINTANNKLVTAENISFVRKNFRILSDQFVILTRTFNPVEKDIYIQHCPMANSNKGADWLSYEKDIRNPYFGASMLSCGEIIEVIE
jgi:Cu(I)/Ag(I) efflux system membrane fusion protein